ncbi:MAG TPA: heme o synthase [Pyrinomonadaceae bacterium]|nr:heme o synthase [Pyrinomonadaceae bacterium]HVQ55215.1 heme o synthase [Pyrinomonadaceae bacterium]
MNVSVAEIEEPRVIGVRERIAAFVELTKPRIALMLVLTSAAGFYLGTTGSFEFVTFFNAVTGIALLAFGVATLNQYLERRTDLLMDRTAKRPVPTGRVSANEALVFGVVQCVVSELYLFFLVNPLTAALGLTVIVGYVFLYTPLKTKTSLSTAIGAIPGAMPPLMGWTAAANEITLGAWAMFAMLFLWQFPHFLAIAWMYRDEYAKAGIKMLPVVEPSGRLTARQIVLFAIMLVPVSLAPFFLQFAGPVFLVGATILGIWFLYESIVTARAKTVERARRLLMVTVLYLPLILLLAVIDHR